MNREGQYREFRLSGFFTKINAVTVEVLNSFY